jgi:hypothetical protein
MRMSSRYTTKKLLVKGHRLSSIILIKVVGEFFKPKGMTSHSKIPSFDLKEVFHTYIFSIGTSWYLDFKSILLNYLALVS